MINLMTLRCNASSEFLTLPIFEQDTVMERFLKHFVHIVQNIACNKNLGSQ